MARTVADAAALLGPMAGTDGDDPATKTADAKGLRDYSMFLNPNGLAGARIGVIRNRLFGYSPAADRLAETAIADMKQRGAVIVDPANIPTLGKFDDSEFDVLLYEFKADLNKYLAWLGPAAPVHSLKDVIAYNDAHADQEMPHFAQEIMLQAEKKGPLTSAKYVAELAKDLRMSRALGIDAVMTKYRLDALVAPTGGPAWLTDLVNGDGGTGAAPGPSTVAAVAGYPHITVPAGFAGGLPVGISFFGRAWSEPTLIKLAYAYEQATKHRRPADVRTNGRRVKYGLRCRAPARRRTVPRRSSTAPSLRLPHRSHDGRQREQFLPDQADDEVVVVPVEAMAGEPDVVRVVAGAERHADGAVLGENHPLLLRGSCANLPLRRSG